MEDNTNISNPSVDETQETATDQETQVADEGKESSNDKDINIAQLREKEKESFKKTQEQAEVIESQQAEIERLKQEAKENNTAMSKEEIQSFVAEVMKESATPAVDPETEAMLKDFKQKQQQEKEKAFEDMVSGFGISGKDLAPYVQKGMTVEQAYTAYQQDKPEEFMQRVVQATKEQKTPSRGNNITEQHKTKAETEAYKKQVKSLRDKLLANQGIVLDK